MLVLVAMLFLSCLWLTIANSKTHTLAKKATTKTPWKVPRQTGLLDLPIEMITEISRHLDFKSFLAFYNCAPSVRNSVCPGRADLVGRLCELELELRKYNEERIQDFLTLKDILLCVETFVDKLFLLENGFAPRENGPVGLIVQYLETSSKNYETWPFLPLFFRSIVKSPSFDTIVLGLSGEFFVNMNLAYMTALKSAKPNDAASIGSQMEALKLRTDTASLKDHTLQHLCLSFCSPTQFVNLGIKVLLPADLKVSILFENLDLVNYLLDQFKADRPYIRSMFLAAISYGKVLILERWNDQFHELLHDELNDLTALPSQISEEYRTALKECVENGNNQTISLFVHSHYFPLFEIMEQYEANLPFTF